MPTATETAPRPTTGEPRPDETDELLVVVVDGYWVQYRKEVTIDQFIAFARASDDLGGAVAAMRDRVVDSDYPGGIGKMGLKAAFKLMTEWRKREEDMALNPPTASD